jgi:hypothetical protein
MSFGKADRDVVTFEGSAHAPDHNKDLEMRRVQRQARLAAEKAPPKPGKPPVVKRPGLPSVALKKDPHHHRVARMVRERSRDEIQPPNDAEARNWKGILQAHDQAHGRVPHLQEEVGLREATNAGAGKITDRPFNSDDFNRQVAVARKAARAAKENNNGGCAGVFGARPE